MPGWMEQHQSMMRSRRKDRSRHFGEEKENVSLEGLITAFEDIEFTIIII